MANLELTYGVNNAYCHENRGEKWHTKRLQIRSRSIPLRRNRGRAVERLIDLNKNEIEA
jgi:hypothetical protein